MHLVGFILRVFWYRWCQSTYQTIYTSTQLFIHLHSYPAIHLSTYLPNYLPTYLDTYFMSACLCICVCIYGIRISIHLFVNRVLILGKRRIYSKSVNIDFSFGIQDLEILSDLKFHSCLRDHYSCLLCSSCHNKSRAQLYNQ